MIVRLTKLKEADSPLHPGNIPIGDIREGELLKEPQVGERFYCGYSWSTSDVQEILSKDTFRTYNSIYKWEKV